MISTRYDFIYLHPPKTAGNSISNLLLPISDDEKIAKGHQDGSDRFEIRGEITPHKHAVIADYAKVLKRQMAKYDIVISIRHPVDRALSWYYSPYRWFRKRDSGRMEYIDPVWDIEAFEKLLGQMTSLTDFLRYRKKIIEPAFVLRYESLHQDFAEFCMAKELPVDFGQMPRMNQSADVKGERFKLRKNRKVRKLVNDRFAEDKEMFKYR